MNCIALFNHEEIGSVSSSGAESSLIPSLLQRLSPTPASYGQSIAHSFLISADMGHAIHPNYTAKHETNHKPQMNRGIVIKTNAKQRYASDAIGSFIVKKLVERKGGCVQEFEVRNDMYGALQITFRPLLTFYIGRAEVLWVPCCLNLEYAQWMSEMPCSQCIPSEKRLARMTSRTRSISLARSLKGSLQ